MCVCVCVCVRACVRAGVRACVCHVKETRFALLCLWLVVCVEDKFETAFELIIAHKLHRQALCLYSASSDNAKVRLVDYLF